MAKRVRGSNLQYATHNPFSALPEQKVGGQKKRTKEEPTKGNKAADKQKKGQQQQKQQQKQQKAAPKTQQTTQKKQATTPKQQSNKPQAQKPTQQQKQQQKPSSKPKNKVAKQEQGSLGSGYLALIAIFIVLSGILYWALRINNKH